jgi:hypothetical protein
MSQEKLLVDAIDALLEQGKALPELQSMLSDRAARKAAADDAAKQPPVFGALSAEEWNGIKLFLLDLAGTPQMDKAYFNARVRLEADDQAGFVLALYQLFKSARLAFPHLRDP